MEKNTHPGSDVSASEWVLCIGYAQLHNIVISAEFPWKYYRETKAKRIAPDEKRKQSANAKKYGRKYTRLLCQFHTTASTTPTTHWNGT